MTTNKLLLIMNSRGSLGSWAAPDVDFTFLPFCPEMHHPTFGYERSTPFRTFLALPRRPPPFALPDPSLPLPSSATTCRRSDEMIVFIISAMPVVELRGAIPVGVWLDLPIATVFPLCVAGNMVPIPIILFALRSKFVQKVSRRES